MDHLPQHDGEPIRVPFLAETRIYRPEEFFSLPGKHDCSITSLVQNGPSVLRQKDAAAFLQEWLFFCLIAQVLQKDIDSNQFLRYYHNQRQVNTEDLIDLFRQSITQRRLSRVSSFSLDDNERSHRMRASLALDEARKFVLEWCSDNDHSSDFRQEPGPHQLDNWAECADLIIRWQHPELCLSLGILGETLDRYRRRHQPWQQLKDDNNPYSSWHNHVTDQRSWGFSNLLRQRMHKTGWCPREIQRINMTAGDLSSIYYISSFAPVKNVDHSLCTLDECADASKLPSLAVPHTASCPYKDRPSWGLKPDQEVLQRIVKAGNIPLLRYDNQENLSITEFVVPQTIPYADPMECDDLPHQPRFIAVSHVWSDGLSPNDGKGLPKCQLNRLRDTMKKSPDTKDLPFWIDSLCVPLDSVELQNKAIQNMGQVYSHAYTVLVLDSTLRTTSSFPETLEAIVRINTGIWSKRMWTLPEGVRAKNLHFDFKDGLLSTADLRRRYEKAKDNPYDREHHVYKAGWLFSPYIYSLRHLRDSPESNNGVERADHKQLAHLWQAMQHREASRPQDETLCLARLVDIDPLPLLQVTDSKGIKRVTEKRMVKFLTLLDQFIGIPPGMIFLPGPKLNKRGFSWAPSSWMRRESKQVAEPIFVPEQRLSFLTRCGLHVAYPAVQLHPGKSTPESTFWIPTARNLTKWYRIEYIPDHGAAINDWESIWQCACSGEELPAIIRSRFGRHDEPEIALLVRGFRSRKSTPLDSKETHGHVEPDVKWVQSLCRVWMQWETDHAIAARLTEDFRYNIDQKSWGETLDAEQRWVVDGYPDCWATE